MENIRPQTWDAMTHHGQNETHSRQAYQIATTSVFLALVIPIVALRIWVRGRMIKSLGWDDAMMVAALFCFIMYNGALMAIVAHGGGTHIRDFETFKSAMNWTVINEVFYVLTSAFLKLSLGLFLLRVVVEKIYVRIAVGTMIMSTVINAFHVFFVIFKCGNPGNFAEHQMSGRCVSNKLSVAMAYEQAAVSTVADLVFAIMPWPLIWRLKLDMRSKLLAGFILSFGAFGSICSIIRFLYIDTLTYKRDFFWSAVNISIWSTIELGTGIVAGSLVTLRPLLKSVMGRTRRPGQYRYASWKLYSSSFKSKSKPRRFGSKSSLSRSAAGISGYGPRSRGDSLPSVFRPWESVGEAAGYTTTCVGGPEATVDFLANDPEALRSGSHNKSLNGTQRSHGGGGADMLNSVDGDRAAIWPYIDTSNGGNAKVVDVTVSVSAMEPEDERRMRAAAAYRTGSRNGGWYDGWTTPPREEQGGGLWGRRVEDEIRKPDRAHRSRSSSDSGRNTPEWDRLPDLVPMENLSARHSTAESSLESGEEKKS